MPTQRVLRLTERVNTLVREAGIFKNVKFLSTLKTCTVKQRHNANVSNSQRQQTSDANNKQRQETTQGVNKVASGYVSTDYSSKAVFRSKSITQLLRSLLILKASSFNVFVLHADTIFLLCRKLLWKPMFDNLMTCTFYGHFAAGACVETSKKTVEMLKGVGIRSMLMVPIESVSSANEAAEEEEIERNFDIIKACILGEASIEENGISQVKLTALCDRKLLLQMNEYLRKHETHHQEEHAWHIKTMVGYLKENRIEEINIAELGEKLNRKLIELLKMLNDLSELCSEKSVRMMIDGEQTYIQAALSYIVLLLQAKFNKDAIVVYNTYQCFRKDTLQRINADYKLCQELDFKIGGKLVRGAYMIEERRLAAENGYDDPINDTFDDTTAMYHSCVDFMLPMVSRGDAGMTIASHNEDTVDFVKSRMRAYGIAKDNKLLCFAQLYGMCDHVTYHLAEEGYRTYKTLPYGSIDDTVLYLCRRAQENQSVVERTQFESLLIRKELRRRLGPSSQ